MSRQKDTINIYRSSFEFFQKIEDSLAEKLGLSELKSGTQILRDSNGWRQNEKFIEYVWIVSISRSFIGWGGLFCLKFKENKFRQLLNPEELVNGIFLYDNNGVSNIYFEKSINTSTDNTALFRLNPFEVNRGIALDGVSYNLRIIASNSDTFIEVNNPNTEEWKKWENELWSLGKDLARKSCDQKMIELFIS